MASDVLIAVHAKDIYGKAKQTHIHLPPATTVANAQAYFTLYAPLWDALTGCFLVDAEVVVPLTKPAGLKVAATANITALVGGRFAFDAGVRNSYGVDLPGLLPTYWIGESDIDSAPTPMINFLAAYSTGLAGFTPTNGSGEDLLSVLTRKRVTHTK